MSDGGTKMYCKNCQKDRICRSIGGGDFGGNQGNWFGKYNDEQRRSIDKYPDLPFL